MSFKTVLVPISVDWTVKCAQLCLYLASWKRKGPQKDGPAVPALLEISPLCLHGPTDSSWINWPCSKWKSGRVAAGFAFSPAFFVQFSVS